MTPAAETLILRLVEQPRPPRLTHLHDLADSVSLDQVPGDQVWAVEYVTLADHEPDIGIGRRLHHRPGLAQAPCHRLLNVDVFAGLNRCDSHFRVRKWRRDKVNGVDLRVRQELVVTGVSLADTALICQRLDGICIHVTERYQVQPVDSRDRVQMRRSRDQSGSADQCDVEPVV